MGEKYNARLLAGRSEHQTREGEDYPRVLVIEFPSYEQAIACYDDPGYHKAMQYATMPTIESLPLLKARKNLGMVNYKSFDMGHQFFRCVFLAVVSCVGQFHHVASWP